MAFRTWTRAIGVSTATILLVAALPVSSLAVTSQAVYYPPDAYEPLDDDPATAPYVEEEVTYHNLHDASDIDWMAFSAEATGQPFVIEVEPTGGRDIDLYLEVFGVGEIGVIDLDDVDGATYNDDAYWNTLGAQCYFEAPAPGDYLVRITAYDSSGLGQIGQYRLTVAYGVARRISGSSRYDTAARLSNTLWPMTDLWGSYEWDAAQPPLDPGCIVVASGENWPDALSGAAFATASDGVLLLTHAEELPSETAAEMKRLMARAYGYDPGDATRGAPMTVYILGGTGAVSQGVEDEIAAMDGVGVLKRLSGASRYETAAAIGEQFATDIGVGGTAFVVGGATPWDALAAGSVAGFAGNIPVLMTSRSDVPTVTIDFLVDHGITDVVVVGGESAVDPTAFAEIQAAVPNVTREFGTNRYATAAAVAQLGVDTYGMNPESVTLVSGTAFPDGLAAAPISRYSGGPLLLTRGDWLVDEVYDFFETNGMPGAASYVVGGGMAIFEEVYWEFQMGIWDYLNSLPG